MAGLEIDRKVETEQMGGAGYGFHVYGKDLAGKEKIIVYTFGIGEDLSFSEQLANKYRQCEIYAFDPTPKSIMFVDKYDKGRFHKFEFYPIGLSDGNKKAEFFLPLNKEYVSGSEIYNPVVDGGRKVTVQMHTLKFIMDMLGHTYIDLLKMDIEGSEFLAIPEIMGRDICIYQICVEVHNRFYEDGEEKLGKMMKIMKDKGYDLVSISDMGEELTFINENFLIK